MISTAFLPQLRQMVRRSMRRDASSMSPAVNKTYESAIDCLNSLQSNFAVVDAIRKSGKAMNENAIPEMKEWLGRAGYRQEDLNQLPVVHIAGTKGKGSTANYTAVLLHDLLASEASTITKPRTPRIGLYTSPHLRSVRERIRINTLPLSKPLFTKYFFEIWHRLEASAKKEGRDPAHKPVYFRFLTLVAFHAFLSERVDAAVIECGIGGAHDSTNIIANPVVTGITKLGIDHQALLGETLPEIAWHKAGIMKPLVPCFTYQQNPKCMDVLRARAKALGAPLHYANDHKLAGTLLRNHAELKAAVRGTAGETRARQPRPMHENAILSQALALSFLKQRGLLRRSEQADLQIGATILESLAVTKWEGRFEIREPGADGIRWYIDCAHTPASIQHAAQWFRRSCATAAEARSRSNPSDSNSASSRRPPPPRILLFNQQVRPHEPLLDRLFSDIHAPHASQVASAFDTVIFSTNQATAAGFDAELKAGNNDEGEVRDLTRQRKMARWWRAEEKGSQLGAEVEARVCVVRAVEEGVGIVRERARELGAEAQGGEGEGELRLEVLVTGSVHLVGAFLSVLDRDRPEAPVWEGAEKYYVESADLRENNATSVRPVSIPAGLGV